MSDEWKIRFPDGSFSTGGMNVRRSKKGKVWKRLSHLKNHLKLARSGVYGNAVAVRYEVIINEVETLSLRGLLQGMHDADQKKQSVAQKRLQDAAEAQERALLAALQLKYPG